MKPNFVGGNCWPKASDHSADLGQNRGPQRYQNREKQCLLNETTKCKVPFPNKLLLHIVKNVDRYRAQEERG
jgi:hypothetical protein